MDLFLDMVRRMGRLRYYHCHDDGPPGMPCSAFSSIACRLMRRPACMLASPEQYDQPVDSSSGKKNHTSYGGSRGDHRCSLTCRWLNFI